MKKIARLVFMFMCLLLAFTTGYSQQTIYEASGAGNIVNVKRSLQKGVSVNAGDKDGWTPLMHAALNGQLDVAKFLVDKGADVNARIEDGSTPLLMAVGMGHLDMVIFLVAKGADVNAKDNEGRTPLSFAVTNGQLDITKVLIENCADVNAKRNDDNTPLLLAVHNSHLNILQYLLMKGAEVNAKDNKFGVSPLMVAAFDGKLDAVNVLIINGADVNAKNNDGDTPLMLATVTGKLDVVQFLVDKGAEVNARNNKGKTSLMGAADNGKLNVVQYLVDKGAIVNAKNNFGDTPLMLAADKGRLDIVKVLVDKGADVNARDNDGKTSLMGAADNGHLDVVEFLKQHGANVFRDQTGSKDKEKKVSLPTDATAETTAQFAAVRDALVIVTTGQGSGSGFVVHMNGKKYLITAEHVLRGGQPFSACLLDGRKLSFVSLDVAEDRDLVRMELAETNVAALVLSTVQHNIGESVSVFGNSEGGAVATSIFGKLIGVGPLFLETDAAFVRGNSGSPICDAKGEVIGIATFAVRDSNPDDWVKQGTRFTDIRRFGVRANDVKWKTIDQTHYFIRADALADIETFCKDLYQLRFTDTFIDKNTRLFDYRYAKEKKRYRRYTDLCELLNDAVVSFNPAIERLRAANYYAKKSPDERGRMGGAETSTKMNKILANQRFEEHAKIYKKVYTGAASLLQNTDWMAQRMKEDAVYWLKVLKLITGKTEE